MPAWNRSRLCAIVLALAGAPAMALGADEKPDKASEPIALHVSPAKAPVPALKYRLFPIEPDRTPGDAAPIYLRINVEMNDAARKEIAEKPAAWLALPIDQFPVAEARKFVDHWGGKLQQVAFGTRRQTCHWNYTLPEQREHAIEIVLPDAQEMRSWSKVLALKARVEIAEGRYDDAIRTIETGLAFSRHVGEGPFLINGLIGVSLADVMLTRLHEFIAQPGAPNLYWALTALPRPLIDLRAAMEVETRLGEWVIPELAEAGDGRSRSEAEWSALLARLHARLMAFQKSGVYANGAPVQVGEETTLARFRDENRPVAKAYFQEQKRPTGGMSDDQLLLLWVVDRYRELRDDVFRLSYLTLTEAEPYHAETEARRQAFRNGPLGAFAELFAPEFSILVVKARLARKVAALRVVEAIRMHAASAGRLPGSLDEIKVVPVPLDPFTNKPFTYQVEGDTATLAKIPPSYNTSEFSYRITLRK